MDQVYNTRDLEIEIVSWDQRYLLLLYGERTQIIKLDNYSARFTLKGKLLKSFSLRSFGVEVMSDME